MQFEHPQILYALFALLVPIVVHLFMLRPYKKVYFTHVDLLKNIEAQTRKPSRLKERILLALRLLFITALVLAFAKPYWQGADKAQDNALAKRMAVYIDNSFSMTRQGEQGSLLDEAKNKALQIVESAAPDDQFLLVVNQNNPAFQTWLYKADFKRRLADIQAVYQQKNLSDIQKSIQAALPKEVNGKVNSFLISDFQQAEILSAAFKPDSLLALHLVPVSATTEDNISIDTLSFASAAHVGQKIHLQVQVSNHSAQPREGLVLRLYVNGQQKAFKSLDIQPADTVMAQLSFSIDTAGLCQAYVEMDEDAINFDNRLYFSFAVQDKWQVGLMYAQQPNPYIQSLFAHDEHLKLHVFSYKQAPYHQWTDLDLLVLDEVPDCSSGTWAELQKYWQQGGHVLFLPPGNSAALEGWNAYFKGAHLPFYGAEDTVSVGLSDIDKDLPFFKDVFETSVEADKNMKKALPKVFKSFPLQWVAAPNTHHLIQNRAGQAMLTATELAPSAYLYQMAFPLQLAYSNLPEYALVVPLLYQMIWQAKWQPPAYFLIGETQKAHLPLKLRGSDAEVKIYNPQGAQEWLPDYNAKAHVLHLGSMPWQIAGIYPLKVADSLQQWVAFNYSRAESDMTADAQALLSTFEKQHPNMQLLYLSDTITQNGLSVVDNHKGQAWYYILWIAFITIFVEILVIAFWRKAKL